MPVRAKVPRCRCGARDALPPIAPIIVVVTAVVVVVVLPILQLEDRRQHNVFICMSARDLTVPTERCCDAGVVLSGNAAVMGAVFDSDCRLPRRQRLGE